MMRMMKKSMESGRRIADNDFRVEESKTGTHDRRIYIKVDRRERR
jgi:hypothetical protein